MQNDEFMFTVKEISLSHAGKDDMQNISKRSCENPHQIEKMHLF